MEHVARKKDGTEDLKLLPECTLPLTGVGVVGLIITDMGVMEVTADGLKLIELATGVSAADVQAKTAARLDVSAMALSVARRPACGRLYVKKGGSGCLPPHPPRLGRAP